MWYTTWAIRSLINSGLAPDHLRIVKSGEWLIDKQILDYGDWSVKNHQVKPGAWAGQKHINIVHEY